MNFDLLSRRRLLEALGVSIAAPWLGQAANAAEPSLTFLAVGDWGRDGQFLQSEVAQRMGESAAALGASFVVSVGDNFYERGVAGVQDPKWKTSFEDIYTAPSLQVPWHVALGNHDYYGDVEAQTAYSQTSRRWRMPKRWYSLTERSPGGISAEIFVVDTTPLIADYHAMADIAAQLAGQDDATQLGWLDRALGASTADWKIVVGHHPIWAGDNSQMGRAGHNGSPDLVAKVDPLLQRHGVRLYLNGHDHELQHTVRGATNYVCTGAGSKMEPVCDTAGADFCSLESGFVACTVKREAVEVVYRDYKGASLHVVDIPRTA